MKHNKSDTKPIPSYHSPLTALDFTDAVFYFCGVLAGVVHGLPEAVTVSNLCTSAQVLYVLAAYDIIPSPRKPGFRDKLHVVEQQVKMWRSTLLRLYAPYKSSVGPLARYALRKGVEVLLGYIVGRVFSWIGQSDEQSTFLRFVRYLIDKVKQTSP